MPGEIFDFEWFVHEEGYDWLEADYSLDSCGTLKLPDNFRAVKGMPWLTVVGEPSSLNLLARRKYYPLREYTCLFRIFAEIHPSPEGILAFANQYGLLGIELDADPGRLMPFLGTAEPVNFWQAEIKAMGNALLLWDLAASDDNETLEEYLRPFVEMVKVDIGSIDAQMDGSDDPVWQPDTGELRWFRTNPEIPELFASGEVKLIALKRVQAIVNEHLGSRVSPRVLWDDYRKGGWGLYFVPGSLAGAIWVQFAQAITENRDYRRCRQCDSWFVIDHYNARTNRYFCSNACRSKAYRERQQQARDMATAGESLENIAARLGSDLETVSRWVKYD